MTTKKENWKPVAIGGMTGIVLGAGTMYAAQMMTADATSDEQQGQDASLQAQDEQSFREAFQTARAEMGPGGVFTWHGRLYNTYTAQEWKAMSNHDKDQFAENVTPEVEISETYATAAEVAETDATETAAPETDTPDVTVAEAAVQQDSSAEVASNQAAASDDDDVRIVGFGDVQLADGRVITVQEVDYNGQRVAVIDVDHDGTPDIAMSDINHNHKMDEGEVIDLQTGEALSFTNDFASEEQTADTTADVDMFNA